MTKVETAFVPGYKRFEAAPWYGCAKKPRCSWCWYFNRIVPRMAANPVIKCPNWKTGEPHVHFDRLDKLAKTKIPTVFSGHFGEIADLNPETISCLKRRFEKYPQHIFQLFTHRPIEFYSMYPYWSKNVWVMGTFTRGGIWFPASHTLEFEPSF